jgi:hypothetical protein
MFKQVIISMLFCSSLSIVKAQNEFHQVILNGGISINAFKSIHKIRYNNFENNIEFGLGKQIFLDYGFFRRMSMGIGYSNHNHILNITDYQYTDGNNTFTESVSMSINTNMYTYRVLFHSLDAFDMTDGIIDVYGGVQGFHMRTRSVSSSSDPDIYVLNNNEEFMALVGGIRVYPTPALGAYVEASILGNYTISAGISIRLGGQSKFTDKKWYEFL